MAHAASEESRPGPAKEHARIPDNFAREGSNASCAVTGDGWAPSLRFLYDERGGVVAANRFDVQDR